jgi:DNA polymerase (family 10)
MKELAKRIRQSNRRLAGRPHLLAGIEVDILADGQLDLSHAVLAELDWVVASIHSRFQDSAEQMTTRMVNAIRSGVVDVIGHPSGRQLGARDPYAFDLEQVLDEAREAGVAMEVNASPDRMDLADRACRRARGKGVKLAISSDAHHESQLANLKYGIWVARRAWLEPGDVVNTEEWETLRRRRKRGP